MTIYLIGSMGVGKSAIGRTIAANLKLPFIDTDHEITGKTGKSINEIFEEHGELYFRKLESEQIRDLDSTKSQIISTGGGIPVTDGNMDYMLKNGVVVYLKATTEDILERLYKGRYKRPAIKSLSIEEIKDKLEKMLHLRVPIYEKSHLSYMRSNDVNADAEELSKYINMFI